MADSSSDEYDREQFFIRKLWELHKSPRDHVDGLLGTPRDYSIFDKMLQDGALQQNFRFRGFPNQSMQSPRQPITTSVADDQRREQEKFVQIFGKSTTLDPAFHHNWMYSQDRRPPANYSRMTDTNGNWGPMPAHGRSDQHRGGLLYGTDQIDNSPRQRGMKNVFNEKSSAEVRKLRQWREEANSDIDKFKLEKRMMDFDREEERKRETEIQSKYYPWDRLKEGHGAPKGENRRRKFWEDDPNTVTYAREPQKPARGHDLFLNTLGGPGGTVVRKDGGPGLTSMNPRGFASPDKYESDLMAKDKTIQEERAKIAELKKELDFLKSPRGQDAFKATASPDKFHPSGGYEPSFGARDTHPMRASRHDCEEPRYDEQRSLDLEATRGGAGAPLKDDRGKAVTRRPITMFGDKIQEQIPGKKYRLPEEPLYDPFGKPGGGAPLKDKSGNTKTHTFGNFEKKVEDGELHKHARSKEVMLNELRVAQDEHRRQKEEEMRRLKAPASDLAEIILSKPGGKPKRDPITGNLASQHLPNSDVSKIKMNYQPVEAGEKRDLHNFLKEQVEENERNRHLEKLRKRQEAMQHFQNFDQNWGHFGGGAPKDRHLRKKVNLDNALFHQDRESRSEGTPRDGPQYFGIQKAPQNQNESYKKRMFEEDIRHLSENSSPRYVKNTTKSTSQNLYEYPTRSPRTVDRRPEPYATGSAQAY